MALQLLQFALLDLSASNWCSQTLGRTIAIYISENRRELDRGNHFPGRALKYRGLSGEHLGVSDRNTLEPMPLSE